MKRGFVEDPQTSGRWDKASRGRWDNAQPVSQHVQVPDTSLNGFLGKLLSTEIYLEKYMMETGCTAALICSDTSSEIVIRAIKDGNLAAAAAKIEELFSMSHNAQARLLGQLAPVPTKAEASSVNFSNLDTSSETAFFKIPKEQMAALATVQNKHLFEEASGATMEWDTSQCILALKGSEMQRAQGSILLKRVTTHCQWGSTESKVARIIKPESIESYKCRLTAMNTTLKNYDCSLSVAKPHITIGKDSSNDVVVDDSMTSRRHCVIEYDRARGGVFIIDVSTNGTFLNGKRLPAKASGKVLVTHGDDVTFREPEQDREFGYMINIQY